jgi:hypothetical protein
MAFVANGKTFFWFKKKFLQDFCEYVWWKRFDLLFLQL